VFIGLNEKHFEKQGSYRSLKSKEAKNCTKDNSAIEKLIRFVEELNKMFYSFQKEICKDYECTEQAKFRYRNQRNTFNNRDSTRTYSTDTRDCFNCGKEGYIQYTCPNRKQNFENTDNSSEIQLDDMAMIIIQNFRTMFSRLVQCIRIQIIFVKFLKCTRRKCKYIVDKNMDKQWIQTRVSGDHK
jgi:hypothetical protein